LGQALLCQARFRDLTAASLSHPLRILQLMLNASTTYDCHWCGVECPRRHPTGRRPLYCRQACRQRAFEHRRRGAFVAGLPAVPAMLPLRAKPPVYEMGNGWSMRHALRPDGVPDRTGSRPTLCGARARKVRPDFTELEQRHPGSTPLCQTCLSIARTHPPQRAIDPSNDLAVMTALAGRLRAAHRRPGADLRPAVTDLLGLVGLPGGLLRRTPAPAHSQTA
jgi:hypothetical protein